MVRTPCCDKLGLKKGTWTPEEDKKLAAYVTRYGCWNWRQLPKYAGLARCGKSCRLRWMNYLRPNIKRGNYTKEEDEIILKLHDELGNKWSAIAAHLPGRTDNEIKNHWHTSLKKQSNKKSSTSSGAQPKKRLSNSKNRTKKALQDNNNNNNDQIISTHEILESFQWSPQPTSSSSEEASSSTCSAFTMEISTKNNDEIIHREGINNGDDEFAISHYDAGCDESFWREPFLVEDNNYWSKSNNEFYVPTMDLGLLSPPSPFLDYGLLSSFDHLLEGLNHNLV